MNKAYHRVGEFKKELLDSRKKTFEAGWDIGFKSAEGLMSLKKGSTSYIYAFPFSGKSSFILQTYIHLAKTQNLTIAVYSPEGGDKISLVAFLAQIYMGKKLHGSDAVHATDEDWFQAIEFINEHFIILDPKLIGKNAVNFTSEELVRQVHGAEKEYGIKVNIILIDPYNLLTKSPEQMRMSTADYVLTDLTYWNQVARHMDVHIQIAMHLRDEETIVDKDTGVEYHGKPFPSKIHQGQNVWRAGHLMVGLWRCPAGVIEKTTGVPYPDNATDILVQKNKIFGAGTTGSFRLFYDTQRMQFYEIINNRSYYCGEWYAQNIGGASNPNAGITPSKSWEDDNDDDIF